MMFGCKAVHLIVLCVSHEDVDVIHMSLEKTSDFRALVPETYVPVVFIYTLPLKPTFIPIFPCVVMTVSASQQSTHGAQDHLPLPLSSYTPTNPYCVLEFWRCLSVNNLKS